MRFLEVETKYKADDIKVQDFCSLMESMKPKLDIKVSSFDYYYVSKTSPESFIRYRTGRYPELTAKSKLKGTNNFVRVECNVKLDPNESEQDQKKTVDKLCDMIGFDHNFTIYKTCFIYFWDDYNTVYYIVYDEHLNELTRFIEIEMKEDYPWESEEKCWERLSVIENTLSSLGIKHQKRSRLSLFEMFKK